MSRLNEYLEYVRGQEGIPQASIEKIKTATNDDEAIKIALQYFKSPDDAEKFVTEVRGNK